MRLQHSRPRPGGWRGSSVAKGTAAACAENAAKLASVPTATWRLTDTHVSHPGGSTSTRHGRVGHVGMQANTHLKMFTDGAKQRL